MVSYLPPVVEGPVHRFIFDMEARASEYQGAEDAPEKLQWAFESMQDITPASLVTWFRDVKDGKKTYHMVGIDNIVLFQDMLVGWFAEKETATQLLNGFGVYHRVRTLFLKKDWPVGDANWYKAMKVIIEEMLLTLRRKGIALVATTEIKNVWKDWGKRGYAQDGQPYQRIIGKTTACWDPWLKFVDAVYVLTRLGREKNLSARPTAKIDFFAPKGSIVGLPPEFTFEWPVLWDYASKRGVTTQEQLDALEKPADEFRESDEVQDTEWTPADWNEFWQWVNQKKLKPQAEKLVKVEKMDMATAFAELNKNGNGNA